MLFCSYNFVTFYAISNSAENGLDAKYKEYSYYFHFKAIQRKTGSVSLSISLKASTTGSNTWPASNMMKAHRKIFKHRYFNLWAGSHINVYNVSSVNMKENVQGSFNQYPLTQLDYVIVQLNQLFSYTHSGANGVI